ncbi:MAG: hypothetical protein RLZ61_60 [Planctomycetota bacterium]|jgi:hypothetical protein
MKSGSCYEHYFSYQRQCTCKKNSMFFVILSRVGVTILYFNDPRIVKFYPICFFGLPPDAIVQVVEH